LLLTFNIQDDEDVAVFRLDLKQIAEGDSLAWKVIHGSADEVSYEEQREREGFLGGVTLKAPGYVAGVPMYQILPRITSSIAIAGSESFYG
jgi:hypothetical protein